jgi:hypothetical protein
VGVSIGGSKCTPWTFFRFSVQRVHFVDYVDLQFATSRRAVSSVAIYPVFELDQRTLDLIDAFS